MSIIQDYRNSLKMVEVEEFLDLYLYRPVAFALVRLISRSPISPNQITLLSLASGLVAAVLYERWTFSSIQLAGVMMILANILDCSDGQLARMQHSGTRFGRLVDGVADWIIGVAVFVAIGIGLASSTGSEISWLLVVFAGLSSGLHSMFFDFVQQEYLSVVRSEKHYVLREIEKVDEELGQPGRRSFHVVRRLGLLIYRRYLDIQQGSLFRHRGSSDISAEEFRASHLRLMRWWTGLGTSGDRTLLILSSLLGHPEVYCWFVVGPVNFYLVVMLLWKHHVDQAMTARARLRQQ